MKSTLTPQQERIITEAMKSGYFGSPEEVLDQALAALSEKRRSRHEAVRRMREFRQKHQLSLGGIRIRDLIHEGHRL